MVLGAAWEREPELDTQELGLFRGSPSQTPKRWAFLEGAIADIFFEEARKLFRGS